MIKIINRTQEINDQLQKDEKVIVLNRPEDFAAIENLNKAMQEVRQNYKVWSQESQISASKTILNS